MRTPLTVATGVLLVAGVVVGVTTAAQAADSALPPVEPIRVEAPAQPVPAVDAALADVAAPADPTPAPVPTPPADPAPQRDADGVVAPPPAGDDDDDDADDVADDDGDDLDDD